MALTKIYDNFVLEDKIEDNLITKLDMNQFLTADYSLTENPGMVKKIHKYIGSGQLDEVAMGEGNTHSIDVTYQEEEYRVGTTQGRFVYFDEEAMTDPVAIEAGLNRLSQDFINDLTEKAIAEMDKSENLVALTSWGFDAFVDAVAKFPEAEGELFCLINPAQQAALRKNLKDDLKYVEAFARTGYIGSVCGVPVFVSKAVPEGRAFMGKKDAVTAFVKKGIEMEQERDANTRKNSVFARKVQIVALTNEDSMVVMGEAQNTAASISKKAAGAKAIGGACSADADRVAVYVNGVKVGDAVPASGSWSINASANLAAGDKIKAIAYEAKKLPSIVEELAA